MWIAYFVMWWCYFFLFNFVVRWKYDFLFSVSLFIPFSRKLRLLLFCMLLLFADIDHSNGINQEEFESIIAILRAHILSQLLVVYFIVLCWSLFRGWQEKWLTRVVPMNSYPKIIHIGILQWAKLSIHHFWCRCAIIMGLARYQIDTNNNETYREEKISGCC